MGMDTNVGVCRYSLNQQTLSRDMVKELLSDTSMNISNRVDLFIALLEDVSDDECKHYLELLDMREIAKVFEVKKRPKIQVTTINQKVLAALKEAGFIDDFVKDENTTGYKVIRKKNVNLKRPNMD